jgi:hypothetical protein
VSSVLARRYRRLLAFYPASHRARREDEMLATLLDAAAPGRRWPRPGEVLDLIRGAARARWWEATGGRGGATLASGLRAGALIWLGWKAARSLAEIVLVARFALAADQPLARLLPALLLLLAWPLAFALALGARQAWARPGLLVASGAILIGETTLALGYGRPTPLWLVSYALPQVLPVLPLLIPGAAARSRGLLLGGLSAVVLLAGLRLLCLWVGGPDPMLVAARLQALPILLGAATLAWALVDPRPFFALWLLAACAAVGGLLHGLQWGSAARAALALLPATILLLLGLAATARLRRDPLR